MSLAKICLFVAFAAIVTFGNAQITLNSNGDDWPGAPTCPINTTGCSLLKEDPQLGAQLPYSQINRIWGVHLGDTLYLRVDLYGPSNSLYNVTDIASTSTFVSWCLRNNLTTIPWVPERISAGVPPPRQRELTGGSGPIGTLTLED